MTLNLLLPRPLTPDDPVALAVTRTITRLGLGPVVLAVPQALWSRVALWSWLSLRPCGLVWPCGPGCPEPSRSLAAIVLSPYRADLAASSCSEYNSLTPSWAQGCAPVLSFEQRNHPDDRNEARHCPKCPAGGLGLGLGLGPAGGLAVALSLIQSWALPHIREVRVSSSIRIGFRVMGAASPVALPRGPLL